MFPNGRTGTEATQVQRGHKENGPRPGGQRAYEELETGLAAESGFRDVVIKDERHHR